MNSTTNTQSSPPDSSLLDETPYGYGKDDWIADQTENAAVTYKEIDLNGATIPYVARAGHLVTTDLYTSQKTAKIFYVSFTATSDAPSRRPIAFVGRRQPELLRAVGIQRIQMKINVAVPKPGGATSTLQWRIV